MTPEARSELLPKIARKWQKKDNRILSFYRAQFGGENPTAFVNLVRGVLGLQPLTETGDWESTRAGRGQGRKR